jgi:Helix-turn-helix domain
MAAPSTGLATDWTPAGRITVSTHDHLRLVGTDEPATAHSPTPEVTLLTITEAAKFLRIGRSAAYELARRFEATGGAEGLPCVRIGDRLLRVPVDALREMVTIRA